MGLSPIFHTVLIPDPLIPLVDRLSTLFRLYNIILNYRKRILTVQWRVVQLIRLFYNKVFLFSITWCCLFFEWVFLTPVFGFFYNKVKNFFIVNFTLVDPEKSCVTKEIRFTERKFWWVRGRTGGPLMLEIISLQIM